MTRPRSTEGTPAAIVLAGGRASRLGGVAKPQLEVGGASLLDHALAAVSDMAPIVVVGHEVPTTVDVRWTRETPDFGGPVAAIAAGLRLVDEGADAAHEVYVLAADVPRAIRAVALLRGQPRPQADGLCLGDVDARPQWLLGRYRTASLRAAVERLGDRVRDASVRELLSPLHLTVLAAGDMVDDVDTWDDLERARATWPGAEATRDRDPKDPVTPAEETI